MNTKPICYQLVGIPASGKTTWVENQNVLENYVYVSSDYFIDKFASRMGKTYSDVFNIVVNRAARLMERRVKRAKQNGSNIIWDQTSMSINSRKRKFKLLPNYTHIAMVFPVPEPKELQRRLDSRVGKNISPEIIEEMKSRYQQPTLEEGFESVIFYLTTS